jgi:hypothetical protein
MDFRKSSYDMKVHLYKFHSFIWEVVIVCVTPPKTGVPTNEQSQDYFHNAQVVRLIIDSLCAQLFNKIHSIEVAKVICNTQ